MRAHLATLVALILHASLTVGQESVTGKDVDQLLGGIRESEPQIKKLILLYQEGAFFVLELSFLGALSGIPSTSHGELKSTEAKSRGPKALESLFPFEDNFLLIVDGDSEYEYLYVAMKSAEKAPWQLIKATKRNVKSKEQHRLPLPRAEQQLEANRLTSERVKAK